MRGQKHLVKCRCVLPHLVNSKNPLQHQFIVFSVLNDDDVVQVKFAQCNNCGIVHKVTDICKSEIQNGKEYLTSILTIDDMKSSMSQGLVHVLEANSADVPTWEYAKFVVDNSLWGTHVVLTSDIVDGTKQGKYVRILGAALFKVDNFVREEIVFGGA